MVRIAEWLPRWLVVGCTVEVDLLAVGEVLVPCFPVVQFVVESVGSVIGTVVTVCGRQNVEQQGKRQK